MNVGHFACTEPSSATFLGVEKGSFGEAREAVQIAAQRGYGLIVTPQTSELHNRCCPPCLCPKENWGQWFLWQFH
jgi:hypothetical protein